MRSAIGAIGQHACRLGATLVLLSAALPVEPLAAQQRSLISPGDAQLRRELRSLEGQMLSSPRGAELQLQRTRRDLVSRSRGVTFSPEAARIDRGLDQVARDLQRQRLEAAKTVGMPVTRATPLPTSYREGSPLPSFDAATTAGRLVGRAEQAAIEGRTAQARSDLATARGLMAGLDSAAPSTVELLARVGDVETRLGVNGG